ncbi:hypothetical protein C823_003026 [Eubacterium plexicaudatum ASF492]|uniref:Methyltransferase type 11 domain-containing protein n=1 Tax=Eubacterium plexicaudatum ASF492 TaxID=1235802 RepID=N2AL77_9FIRM|nr:hypothetical protein C823_003026 [Eubacterium plexicaudatum ASF492]
MKRKIRFSFMNRCFSKKYGQGETREEIENTYIRSKAEVGRLTLGGGNTADFERVLGRIVLNAPDRRLNYPGYCAACGCDRNFILTDMFAMDEQLCFRESMICPVCGLNNRQRFMAGEIFKRVNPDKDHVYVYEQTTPFYRVLKARLKYLTGSEYLGDFAPGTVREDGIRHEDAMNLSFPNESFDYAISNDVLEHVADIRRALKEMYRVLKAGGIMMATFPFIWDLDNTVRRAKISDGNIEYLLEPIYHGNPLGGGSLVFYDYGWDFMEFVKSAGFSDAYFVPFYSVMNGHLGRNTLYYFVAVK